MITFPVFVQTEFYNFRQVRIGILPPRALVRAIPIKIKYTDWTMHCC
jgi:hypothetical protein